jgi:ferric enterobactin receptor
VLELDAGYGRQSNIYTGDTQNVGTNAVVDSMIGHETNRMTRRNFGLTHKGKYDFGSSLSFVQYTQTENRRIQEGLVGATEGMFLAGTPPFVTSDLKDLVLHSEFNLPLRAGLNQMLTAGIEWSESRLDDPTSNTQSASYGSVPGLAATGRSAKSESRIFSVFVEDNIELSTSTILTPGLRFDHHDQSGSNWSPALNLSHMIDDRITVKAGIARAYKAPNLYQSNPNYLLYSSGNGCSNNTGTTGCYLVGNDDLDPETSINKEIGIEFKQERLAASITLFRNDYRNKIQQSDTPYATTVQSTNTRAIYQWANIPKAVVSGLEGNLRLPVTRTADWNTNFTYMLESKNKSTGDYLSVIPQYTVNSSLDWQVNDKLGTLFSVTWYGQQKPMKYDYKGDRVQGTSANTVSPYAIASFSSTYTVDKHLKLTAGINNLFDKRQFRAGNSVGVTRGTLPDGTTGDTTALGAGAYTYNEPGRTLYVSLTSSF